MHRRAVVERHCAGVVNRRRGERGVATGRVQRRLEELLRRRVRGAIVADGLLLELSLGLELLVFTLLN